MFMEPPVFALAAAPVPNVDLLPIGELFFLFFAFIGTLVVTLGVGAALLSYAGTDVRAVAETVQTEPLRSGGLGVAAVVAGVGVFLLLGVTAAALAQVGAPQQVGLLVLLPAIVGGIGIVVATALGAFTVGYSLLDLISDEPNQWLALVVGAGAVSLLVLVPGVNYAVFLVPVVAIGGVVEWLGLADSIEEQWQSLLED